MYRNYHPTHVLPINNKNEYEYTDPPPRVPFYKYRKKHGRRGHCPLTERLLTKSLMQCASDPVTCLLAAKVMCIPLPFGGNTRTL